MTPEVNEHDNLIQSVILALQLITVSVTQVSAAVRNVPGAYSTIQIAVDAALPGDTVLVAPGVYTDSSEVMIDGEMKLVNVHITKLIILLASGTAENTKIDGSGSDVAIYIENTTCHIGGFEIATQPEGFGCIVPLKSLKQSLFDYIGVLCENAIITITSCDIHRHSCGLHMKSSFLYLNKSKVHDTAVGIQVERASDGIVEENEFFNCGHAIYCEDSSPDILKNDFYNKNLSCTAIRVFNSTSSIRENVIRSMLVVAIEIIESSPIVAHNKFADCWQDLSLFDSDSVVVQNNVFENGNSVTVDIYATTDSRIENNTLVGGMVGVVCRQANTNPIIKNNIIYEYDSGVVCFDGADPEIFCNDFFGLVGDPINACNDNGPSVNGNISVDPEFCGIPGSGNYYLQSDSPCAPGNHPDSLTCGLIGAYEVNCGLVPVRKVTWGEIKALLGEKK